MRSCLHTIPTIILISISFSTAVLAQKLPPRRTVLPSAIREVSGMVRTADGNIWLVNDSRNPPELFLVDPIHGKLLETKRLPVPNRDWEDITLDAAGYLYIGDFGNNKNARRDLCVFRYHLETGTLDSIQFQYPDQTAFPPTDQKDWNFNCEAMVFFQDSLHLFSKNVFIGNGITKHYVVPAKPGKHLAILRDSLHLKNRVVTGACLSPDGETFAVTSYIIRKKWGIFPSTRATAYFFTGFTGSAFLHGTRHAKRLPKRLIARQFESISWWDSKHLLVANEGKGMQKQAVWRIKKPG
ncbi:MAG: hypothetical protein H6569_09510 [Lewinellaceae bacterium]|nr:hypothetical protein [Lewinellaceae bacterium]